MHILVCVVSTITSIKIYAYIVCTMHWADSQGNNKASRLFLAVNTWGEFVTCHFLLSFFFSSFLGDALTYTHTMLMSPNGCSMLCFDEGRNMFCVIFLLSDRYHSSWRRVPAFYEFSLTWKINWRGIWNVLIFNPFSPSKTRNQSNCEKNNGAHLKKRMQEIYGNPVMETWLSFCIFGEGFPLPGFIFM